MQQKQNQFIANNVFIVKDYARGRTEAHPRPKPEIIRKLIAPYPCGEQISRGERIHAYQQTTEV